MTFDEFCNTYGESMNPLQQLQAEFHAEYERGEITYEELQQKLEESYYDFNND